ncbi:MAG: MotA/TolQ/ExbB proton channel family protein [Planctomycetaceae bacterium]|nr:MotA/TolQ/ExbB proton channel family protein [Planctomycetaceae bacterium]
MSVLEMVKLLADACYGFLALNFLWGLFCVIVIWRRLGQLRFRSAAAETEFVDEMSELLRTKKYAAATERCDFDFRALPRLCLLMLTNREQPYPQLRQLVSTNLQRHILADLEHRLNWIVSVIKNGPLLGLFGTVLGMMAAFGRIGTGEKVLPSQIADEISVALICTAMGLATAIPLGYILVTLNIRTRSLQESLESNLSRLLQYFR